MRWENNAGDAAKAKEFSQELKNKIPYGGIKMIINFDNENGYVTLRKEDFLQLLEGYCQGEKTVNYDENSSPIDLEIKVTEYLINKRVRQHLSGFNYLRKAILLGLEDAENLKKITVLYELVGRKFNVSGQKTERAMRHAIETSGRQVTNSEFIFSAVDEIRLEIRMGGVLV